MWTDKYGVFPLKITENKLSIRSQLMFAETNERHTTSVFIYISLHLVKTCDEMDLLQNLC